MKPDSYQTLDFARDLSFSEILTNPFLDIAARFWTQERYEAFQVCYRSMRRIDDLIDDRKASGRPLESREADDLAATLGQWLRAVRERHDSDPFHAEFLATLQRFGIPLWPWERLCEAMIYDLKHEGFANLKAFLRYTEGAAVAPASVFMHLCGARKTEAGFEPPSYDIRAAARPLAVFSYFVHIIRDFQKDQLRGLDYYADNLLTEYNLTTVDLRRIAGRKGAIPENFRRLIERYLRFARYYQRRARVTVDTIRPCLEARYQLSLEIVYGLYSLVFERIDARRSNFTSEEFNPAPEQVQARLERIVADFKPA